VTGDRQKRAGLARRLRRRHVVGLLVALRRLPDRSDAPAPAQPWEPFDREIPEDLQTIPGEDRDRAEEERSAAEQPLHEFFSVNPDASELFVRKGLGYLIPSATRLGRAVHRLRQVTARKPSARRTGLGPEQITDQLRERAREIGLSRIGMTANDPKYTFGESDAEQLPNVIVCLMEQDWELTQTIPSDEAEKSAMLGYAEGMTRTAALAGFLKELGYNAAPQGFPGDGITIHYGVEAGLGQLGLNGQLLTPEAGSRCRILLITTDAPLVFDEPVDYGLHKVCDECRACVRNCPVGAIPQTRKPYRGVTKAKLNTARCLPVVIQASGCAICMKVCPVQRYGLAAILDHREETGEILGLGTDELEGYDWPLDDAHYGPGETPKVDPELIREPKLSFDVKRTTPAPGIEPIRFVGRD